MRPVAKTIRDPNGCAGSGERCTLLRLPRPSRIELRDFREAPEMDMRHAPAAREKRAHITTRLRAMQLAECPGHPGNRHVLDRVGGDHEEESRVGTALVQLT